MDVLLSPTGGLTLLAPLVAIVCALLTQRVHPSLLAGAVVGALVATGGDVPRALLDSHLDGNDTVYTGILGYLYNAVFHLDHLTISAFSCLVAATVGVMGVTGGTRALVRVVERLASGRRGAMVSSWVAGAVVFFDDYANCLVVGSAMGPVCDRAQVSRAKLAYIVDSTAAPVASLALVSTWVGYEVGLIGDALLKAGVHASGFAVFIEALPYRFYSIFTLFFVGAIAISGRDFGPMAQAEAEALAAPPPAPEAEAGAGATPWLAALPVGTLVLLTFVLLILDGRHSLGDQAAGAAIFEVLGAADAYRSMFLGSLGAFSVVMGLGLLWSDLGPMALLRAAWQSVRAVAEALAVLYLAWILGDAIGQTGAADFLASVLGAHMDPWMLPTVTFCLAAATAFATGTSFGTMAILIPLAVPLAVTLAGPTPGPILWGATAAVLAGACLGDHASPISDTTVLSAVGAGVDLITHVRTQLPYALTTGVLAILVGYLPAALGLSPWLLIPLGALSCGLVVRLLGRLPPSATAP